VDLAVYDVRGRKVRSLVSRPEAAGLREVRWDGRDDRGQRVASGVYFVRLRAEAEVRLGRVVLAR